MITVAQIKAGRALLGWSQKHLADRSGYALPTLNNIERQLATPRPQTMNHIKQALEEAGVQFLENTGVQLVKEALNIEMLEGTYCLRDLYEDLYNSVKEKGGEMLLSSIDEQKFLEFDRETMLSYMQRIGGRPDIVNKLLFKHGDTNTLPGKLYEEKGKNDPPLKPIYSQWRWLPENLFGLAPMIIYGDKCATIVWGDHVRIIVIQNHSIVETYKKQFWALWENAQPIPPDMLD